MIVDMKKIIVLFLSLFLGFQQMAKADEGMWLLSLIKQMNIGDMKEKGLKLDAEDIYSINQSSLKDAIVHFSVGCTGEIVSEDGLMLTNHHCGHGAIQYHSTLENDYLKDGFWAQSREEELYCPGLYVRFLKRMEDVTAQVLKGVNEGMNEEERNELIGENKKTVMEKALEGNDYEVGISSMLDGNQYFLFVYETYNDIRLVGAPPESIGSFGGDYDNWMWPRHTADFSIFRVYMSPDGKPAQYDEKNVPLKAKTFLKISTGGIEEHDYTMIIGYPGSTDRYRTAAGVKQTMEISAPIYVKVRDAKIELLREAMGNDDEIRIQYSSKYARTSNGWKLMRGIKNDLRSLNVYDKKKEIEDELSEWINQSEERKQRYGWVLGDVEEAYSHLNGLVKQQIYYQEVFQRGIDLTQIAMQYRGLLDLLEEGDEEKIKDYCDKKMAGVDARYKDVHLPTDKRIFAKLLEIYNANIENKPEIFAEINKRSRGNYRDFTLFVYENSIFADPDKLKAFLAAPDKEALENDPAMMLVESATEKYKEIQPELNTYNTQLDRARRYFMQALMEMEQERKFYPNANGTMRLTYGEVIGYEARDAVVYDYQTTYKGILEKYDPDIPEYQVKPKLLELLRNKDFGRWANEDGVLITCFVTNNDITGGNSGSGVLNGNGELIGLAFDKNWEAAASDIYYMPEFKRTVVADIRYVLFVIDKFAGASHLIDEMKLVD